MKIDTPSPLKQKTLEQGLELSKYFQDFTKPSRALETNYEQLYKICWNRDPNQRFSAQELLVQLDNLMKKLY